jgi:aminomethyltransferase
MPIPTPFHRRTSALCESNDWRNWSGYLVAGTYEPSHEREYYAIRNAAGLIDISPLYKYDLSGADALRTVNKIVTRDISTCKIGQIVYSPWCDEAGKIIDDGTIWRMEEDIFRITAADPNLRWFQDCGFGMDVTVNDRSTDLVALALQGPNSRAILGEVFPNDDLESMAYYRFGKATLSSGNGEKSEVTISRTGYTGDLGYELWIDKGNAELLWDVLVDAGANYGLLPAGMVALDIARIEAGLLLIEVDYISSQRALTEARKSSPFATGLGWTVALNKGPYVGRNSLLKEKESLSKWTFVGLDIDWPSLEKLFAVEDLPPMVAGRASRDPAPIYARGGRQIGQLTSRTFSPLLKKYIALATVESDFGALGREVEVEITVEFSRKKVPAKVVRLPFYNPPQKRG